MDPMFSLPRPPAHAAGPAHRAVDRFERGPGDRFDRGPGDRSDRSDRSDRGGGPRDRGQGARGAEARDRAAGRAEAAGRSDAAASTRDADRGERSSFGAALREACDQLDATTKGDKELVAVVEETLHDLEIEADAATLQAVGWPLTLLAAAQQAKGEQVDAESLVVALEEGDGTELLGELEDEDAAALLGELEGEDAAALLAELKGELKGELEGEGAEELVAEAEAMLADLAAEVDEEVSAEEVVAADGDADDGDADDEATDAEDAEDTAPAVDTDTDAEAAEAAAAAATAEPEATKAGPPRAERADTRAAAQPTPPGQQVRAEPAPGAEGRGAGPVGEVHQTMEMPRGEPPRTPQLPAGVQRVLEMVAQLEKMPPPRQLVLDLGDLRLRVGMEDGQVKLTVLKGGDDRATEELLADARDALAEQGFDLSKEGEEQDDDGGEQGEGQRSRAGTPTGSRRRFADTGLRL